MQSTNKASNPPQQRSDRSRYASDQLRSASNGAVSAIFTEGGGVVARASKPLTRGDCILQCSAAAIAIDPMYRRLYCAYCAKPYTSTDNGGGGGESTFCEICGIVGICARCSSDGAHQWHVESGECDCLNALVQSFCTLFGLVDDNDGGTRSAKGIVEMAKEVDSSYVITIRLLHRRWHCDMYPTDDSTNPRSEVHGDGISRMNDTIAPLPPVDWKLFDTLHKTKVSGGQYDAAISALCKQMKDVLSHNIRLEGVSWITKDAFNIALERVVGCGHAVVDLTLNMGFQTLGRALFLEHSFYNHACNPNAFISCLIGGPATAVSSSKSSSRPPSCALVARVHCLADIKCGDDITLSYIPTSGLAREERRQLLRDGYQFECKCRACRLDPGDKIAESWDSSLKVPDGSDLSSLREVQYSCNQTLFTIDGRKNINSDSVALDGCIGMVQMSAKGIKNQEIASSHEVSLEVYRLLASAYSLSARLDDAAREHEAVLHSVEKILSLFDPITLATQMVEYAFVLHRTSNPEGEKRQLGRAKVLACAALGSDHPFTTMITKKLSILGLSSPCAPSGGKLSAAARAGSVVEASICTMGTSS